MATVMHGRRKGRSRNTPELPQPHGMLLPDGTDLRQVTVLSKSEWDRIERELNRRQIEEERIQRIRKEQEIQKEKSKELVKSWGNTLAGQRQRKLQARKQREEKEEAERQQIDIEEAKYQAGQRRAAIDKAKTQQYYQTDRVKNFHSALQLTEVLKERDAQLELNILKAKANEGQDREWLEKARREYDDSVRRDQEAALKRMKAAEDNYNFMQKQVGEHLTEQNLEQVEDRAEGEELKKLSVAYEREKERLDKIRAEERRQMMLDNQQQIQDVQKMKQLKEVQQEEENEECRIFAAAKRKMMRLRAEKERDIYTHKQQQLDRIREKLAAQMKQAIDNEDERIEKAQQEKEEKFIAVEKLKDAKRKKGLHEQAAHRSKQMQEQEDMKKLARREELEQVQLRKAADEVFRRNEMEKSERRWDESQRRTDFLFDQMDEKKMTVEQMRKQQLALDQANEELVRKEEQQFQEYANKVIKHSEDNGRNVYPLRKAAQEGAGGGLGPVFPGKGGVRPSYMAKDKTGVQLPHYQRVTTENVKQEIYGKADSKARLGFVW
ncbi:cilia- and flagella- associated protein 210-like [Littorina saxatilis]|uniref:Trichohyalin-plectin-homology domain-containing protein n=1 Tax=Littorina saxatilis TaxID=31220 RepID=A0AAN9GJP3_9CAEN